MRTGSSRTWSGRWPTRCGRRTTGCGARPGAGFGTTWSPTTWWSSHERLCDRPAPPARERAVSPSKQRVEIEGRTLSVSNLEKVLFPEVGVTKAQVIDYYVRIAPVLLPHLAGRPVTFTRWPDGVEGQKFFEKNSARHAPEWVRRVTIPRPGSSTGREALEMVILESTADLAWSANLAALELHVPQWQVDDDGVPQLPDLLVLDLDPGPDTGIYECCVVAERLGERLEADGLDPVVKTSGSKGMQVYAPIESPADREHPSRYAKRLAQELSAETPDSVVWRMEKVLRPGKVLIDWSQNNPAKTTVAPYSLRARAGATVSTPIGWDEVDAVREGADPATLRFTTGDVLDRVEEYGDLFDVANAHRAHLPEV